ncbi:AEC family transporter [Rhizobium oryzicola]|uniref:AEC family transporter n=1 Tax=Rhizobium oryzicola TaxID=1232668 RepID=A0ABT8T171_9HYPH|nr:AEC family transporter [Rhizobium oryzicola]MDO1583627.1 AEC family transporter [Rhizobium oryzicola]
MTAILALLIPFFGLILIGFIAARVSRQGVEALGWMNVFVVYCALPALFFKLVSQTPVEELTRLDFIAAQLAAVYLVFVVIFAIARLGNRQSVGEATMQAFGGAYGNIGYMGPSLTLLVLGQTAAVPVALIVCFENALHFIVAPALMSLSGGERRSAMALTLDIFRRVALHPFIVSTVMGFIVAASGTAIPVPLARLVDYLAQAAAPCALFAMGVTLALRPARNFSADLFFIAGTKLLVLPLVVCLILGVIGGMNEVWVHAAIVLAALPTATNVFVISQHYGIWEQQASSLVLVTTLLSILTLPVILYLISAGFI